MDSRAETSRSVVVSVRAPPSVASISTPVRAGIPGRDETPRWTVCRASDRSSRSHRIFTTPPPRCFFVLHLSPSVVVGAGEKGETPLLSEPSGPVRHVEGLGESVHASTRWPGVSQDVPPLRTAHPRSFIPPWPCPG